MNVPAEINGAHATGTDLPLEQKITELARDQELIAAIGTGDTIARLEAGDVDNIPAPRTNGCHHLVGDRVFHARKRATSEFKLQLLKTMNPPVPILSFGEEQIRPFVGERLDVFLAAVLERSRSHAQTLLKGGAVQVQPAPKRVLASYHLRKGDVITVQESPAVERPPEPEGEEIPLDILYEDDALMALNKQPGLVVHPAAGHWSGTLVNALVHHRGEKLAHRGGEARLGIVHRLDKDTSGVMLIAKTDEVHERLAPGFCQA